MKGAVASLLVWQRGDSYQPSFDLARDVGRSSLTGTT